MTHSSEDQCDNKKKRMTVKTFNGIQDKTLSKPALERQIVLDFNKVRDDGVAVTSAGPYANLHLDQDT